MEMRPPTITLVSDQATAEKLWKQLSPAETIYDDWDFRETFHRYYRNELFFYTANVDGKVVALMPLQMGENGTTLEFFGGDYMEDNRVFALPGYEYCIPELYKHLDKPNDLEFIRSTDPYTETFPIVDYKYVLPLDTFKSSDDYIEAQYHGETKKKFKKRLRKIDETNPQIIVNNWEDLELLFQLNIDQFKDGPRQSMFAREYRQDIFRDLCKAHETFTPRLLTFVVNGEKQAVSLALLYNKNYASINTGIVAEPLLNLKEYIHIKKFDDAITEGCTLFDAFVRDYGWKEKWGLKKIPQYQFKAS